MKRDVFRRFITKVDVSGPEECWEWQAYRHPDGYGHFRLNGRKKHAHRVAWDLTNGPIPEGQSVLHKCDNPPCVNPDHLFLGTQADNMRDMAEKGRSGVTRKLTENDVLEIRASDRSQRELAAIYGVTPSNIHAVQSRVTWTHI